MTRKLVGFDWALKKLLRSKANFEVLEGFLSVLLEDRITIVEILESETNRRHAFDKQSRVDLKARNQRGEYVIIEVQYEKQLDYLQRILHGTSRTLVEHLDVGEPYEKIAKVISISILYFELGRGRDYVYHGTTVFRGLHWQDELELSPEQFALFGRRLPQELFPEYWLLEVGKFDDIARTPLDEWIWFLKHAEIKPGFTAPGLRKAGRILDRMKLPEAERRALERYEDDLHQEASMFNSSYGAGERKGRSEGRSEERAALVRSMHDRGLAPSEIAGFTGLEEAEVRDLLRRPSPAADEPDDRTDVESAHGPKPPTSVGEVPPPVWPGRDRGRPRKSR